MENKKIVIIGPGGVGGYFGFQLNEANQHNHISFVARDKTFERIKTDGLTLLSPDEKRITHPDAVYRKVAELRNPDLVLICVKEYDLQRVCNELQMVISPNTILLPMLNGADIYERIRSIISDNIILPSCVYIAAHIKEKGVVEYSGQPGKLVFGRDPRHFSADIKWVEDLLNDSGINYDFHDNADAAIWTKFMLIAAFGLVTAKHNSSIGAVCRDEAQRTEARHILEEIKQIADKKGNSLHDDVIENTFKKAASFKSDIKTSIQRDINSGKKNNELDLFAGTIMRYGAELNIPTPFTEEISKNLKMKLNKLNSQ